MSIPVSANEFPIHSFERDLSFSSPSERFIPIMDLGDSFRCQKRSKRGGRFAQCIWNTGHLGECVCVREGSLNLAVPR
jgi:hypothetical protein